MGLLIFDEIKPVENMTLKRIKYPAVFFFCFFCCFIAGAQSIDDFSTDLPLVIIDTEGRQIVDEPKVMARMKIIDNPQGINRFTDTPNDFNGHIGIEKRGASSQSYPQTPYGIETRLSDGHNLNISVLGLPAENDWVLLSNYNDKSFMRNVLAYKMFESLGHYAPRTRLVDVIINNDYKGIYLFGEKIKPDEARLNIAKLTDTDNTGDEVTGGYIFKVDYYNENDSWLSNYHPLNYPHYDVHFVYHDPKWDELTNQQKSYLRNYVNNFEWALYSTGYTNPDNGYRNFIDVESFIDYFIVNEIARNNDGFKKSRYFHKDRNGKIAAGPVWDFDWAWKNINECYIFKATDGSGWAYKVNDCNPWVKSPGWMVRLFYDSTFKNQTNCRYFEARSTTLSDERLFSMIDSVASVVQNAQERHFQRWQILGKNVGAPEVGDQPLTYEGEVVKLKEWITIRLNWLDENMVGSCPTTIAFRPENASGYQIYPNPASGELNIRSENDIEKIEFFSLTGEKIRTETNLSNKFVRIDVSSLHPGMYVVMLSDKNGQTSAKKIMIKQ